MSQHKQAGPEGGVITSDAVHGRRSTAFPLMVMTLVAVFIASGAVVAIYHFDPGRTKQPATSSGKQLSGYQQQLAAAVSDAQSKLSQAKTSADKAAAYTALGTAYANEGEYRQAVAAYNDAITNDGSLKASLLENVAYTYAVAGEKDKAIAAYQELIHILQMQPDSTQVSDTIKVSTKDRIQTYEAAIQTLQNGGSL